MGEIRMYSGKGCRPHSIHLQFNGRNYDVLTQSGKKLARDLCYEAAVSCARRKKAEETTRERKCMTCQRSFISPGPQVRMCDPCRNSVSEHPFL